VKNKLGVIGYPVKHSLSPIMHRIWLDKYGLDGEYNLLEIHPDRLQEQMRAFRVDEWKGFSVTIPHKVAIFSLLDESDDKAKRFGAVNTVINQGGYLKGTNTDGDGFLQSLSHAGFIFRPTVKALIIGAGGAARAVGLSLAETEITQIDFTNRTVEKAEELRAKVNETKPSAVLDLQRAEKQLGDYDLIINATSVGMEPYPDPCPLSLSHVSPGTFCADLIYKPLKTTWLKEAEKRDCQTLNGLSMLIHQGALAFEQWFGIFPEIDGMEEALIQGLNKSQSNAFKSC